MTRVEREPHAATHGMPLVAAREREHALAAVEADGIQVLRAAEILLLDDPGDAGRLRADADDVVRPDQHLDRGAGRARQRIAARDDAERGRDAPLVDDRAGDERALADEPRDEPGRPPMVEGVAPAPLEEPAALHHADLVRGRERLE